jgi:hypothetical protein
MKSTTFVFAYFSLIIFWTLLALFICISWIVNIVKLVQCDFDSPYKEEAVRGIGLIPIVAPFVAWQDFNEDTQD